MTDLPAVNVEVIIHDLNDDEVRVEITDKRFRPDGHATVFDLNKRVLASVLAPYLGVAVRSRG